MRNDDFNPKLSTVQLVCVRPPGARPAGGGGGAVAARKRRRFPLPNCPEGTEAGCWTKRSPQLGEEAYPFSLQSLMTENNNIL